MGEFLLVTKSQESLVSPTIVGFMYNEGDAILLLEVRIKTCFPSSKFKDPLSCTHIGRSGLVSFPCPRTPISFRPWLRAHLSVPAGNGEPRSQTLP